MASDYHTFRRKETRKRFIKSSVIGFGFLSGVWAHIGFDPSNWTQAGVRDALLAYDPVHATWITLAFLLLPGILTAIAVLLIYRRAGVAGFVATALAYVAGLWLDERTLPLLVGALIIGFFAAGRR